jgi:hypothetical protein
MEFLVALVIVLVVSHGVPARGRAALRDGTSSFRNALRAVRGHGGSGARRQLLDDYEHGRSHVGDRWGQPSTVSGPSSSVGTSRTRLLTAAAWRGYKGGWAGTNNQPQPGHADLSGSGNQQPGETAVTDSDSDTTATDAKPGGISELRRKAVDYWTNRIGDDLGITLVRDPEKQPKPQPTTPGTGENNMSAHPLNPWADDKAPNNGVAPDGTPLPSSGDTERYSKTWRGADPRTPRTANIATATGGEVLNYSQLLAELDAIVAESRAEMEDRQAAKQRAQDDVQRIDVMLASLGQLELDTESLAKLQAIGETNGQKMNLATQAATNAEHRYTLAINAKDTVQRKHQMLHEAHVAAGRDAAHKQFYQAS